jgi:hypothetical protein
LRNSIWATAILATLAAWGCGSDRPAADRAIAIARGHAEDADAFERWATRIATSDTQFPSREALEEAAFAPVRRREAIAGAWIERRGPDPASFAHPPGATIPGDLGWARVNVDGRAVEVAQAGEREWVRRRLDGVGGGTLLLTLAFRARP